MDVRKTVLLFPGLDAIFSSAKMKLWLANPSVSATLQEASTALSQLTGQSEDIAKFIESNKHLHLVDFDRTLIALTSLQVGIARQLKMPWDIAQGCSHGDIARAVLTESVSFREAIEFLWIFAELRKSAPNGYTANVRTRDGSELSPEILQWLKSQNTPVSLWSTTNATIGGDEVTLERIRAEAPERGLKVKPVLQFPVHSPAMMPAMLELAEKTKHYKVSAPNKPVFSSVWVRYLTDGNDVRAEALAGAIHEVRWMETLTYLHAHENVGTFINVGPSNTLTGWLFENPKFKGLRLVDCWDLAQEA